MIYQCPNCDSEFIEQRENCYCCNDCGCFQFVDGKWRSVPEPKRVEDPEPPRDPEPEPDPDPEPPEPLDMVGGNVKEYLGGLITVEVEEENAEENS